MTDTDTANSPHVMAPSEQRALMRDPNALICLINHHDAQETAADAIEPGLGSFNAKRVLELLAIGRQIIALDPSIWPDELKAQFALRHEEKNKGVCTISEFVEAARGMSSHQIYALFEDQISPELRDQIMDRADPKYTGPEPVRTALRGLGAEYGVPSLLEY